MTNIAKRTSILRISASTVMKACSIRFSRLTPDADHAQSVSRQRELLFLVARDDLASARTNRSRGSRRQNQRRRQDSDNRQLLRPASCPLRQNVGPQLLRHRASAGGYERGRSKHE